jgi:hypothetical protein
VDKNIEQILNQLIRKEYSLIDLVEEGIMLETHFFNTRSTLLSDKLIEPYLSNTSETNVRSKVPSHEPRFCHQ